MVTKRNARRVLSADTAVTIRRAPLLDLRTPSVLHIPFHSFWLVTQIGRLIPSFFPFSLSAHTPLIRDIFEVWNSHMDLFSYFLLVMPMDNVHSCESRESKSCQQIHKRTSVCVETLEAKREFWITNDDVLNRSSLGTRHLKPLRKKTWLMFFVFFLWPFSQENFNNMARRRILKKLLLFCFLPVAR